MSKKVGLPSCDNCGVTCEQLGAQLKDCSRCHLVRYCGRECQAQHWKAKPGHKAQCIKPQDRVPSAAAEAAEDSHLPKCVICLAAFNETFSIEVVAVKLKCGHKFHEVCLLEACRDSKQDASCPSCRKRILSGESFDLVNYKNLLLGKRIFKKLGMPYSQQKTIVLAEQKTGAAAVIIQREVSAIADDQLFEEGITCQLLCKIYLLPN